MEHLSILSENLDIFKLIVVDGNNGEISTRPLDDPIANAQSGRLTSFGEDSVAIFTILSNEPNNIGIYNINGSLGRVIDQSNTSSLAFIYGNSNNPSVAYTNTIIQDGYGIRSLFYDPITNTGLSPCESPSGTVPFWVESSAMRSDGLGVVLVRDSVNAILVSPSGTQSVLLSNSELEDPFRAQIAAFSQARTALVIMPLRGSTTTEYYLYSANGSLINSLTLEGSLQSAHPLGGSHLGEYGVMTKVDTNHFRLYQFDSDGGLSRERNLIDYPLLDPTQTIRNSISDFSLGNGDTIAIASSNNEITIHAPDGTILTLTSTGNDVVFNPRFSSDGTFTLQRANISTDPNRIIEIHQNPLVDLIPEAIIDDSGPQLTDPLFLEETYTRIIGRSSSTSDGNILLQEIVPGGSSLSTVATGDVTGFISRISDYDITPYGVVTPISSTAGRLAFFQFDAIVNTSSPLQNSSGLSVQNPVRQELVITLDSSIGQEAELINTNGQMLGKLNLPNLQDGGEIRIARPSYLQAGSYVLRVGERSAVLIVE